MKFGNFENPQPKSENYYDILGISRDASQEEIRKAYRKLDKESHPDAVGSDSKAEDFLKVTEAYENLADKDKRAEYDRATFTTHEYSNNKNGERRSSGGSILHGEYYNTLNDKEKIFYDEMIKDKTIKMILEILAIQKPEEFEKTVKDYFAVAYQSQKELEKLRQKAYQSQKDLEKADQDLKDITKRREELKRQQEELEKNGDSYGSSYKSNLGSSWGDDFHSGLSDNLSDSNFSSFMRGGQRFGSHEVRNLVGNLGVESSLGYERLVDQNTGRSVGYGSYKKIEYQNGIIIGMDSLGRKSIINKDGSHNYSSYQDIIFRDGLVIGRDTFGHEQLVDKNTGKQVGYRSYDKIYKEGGKIFGVNTLGRREEIKFN
jgi:curved DNA-binding protein CbpA